MEFNIDMNSGLSNRGNTITHVALIFGGPSAEHEVSLCSAKNIQEILKNFSFQVSLLAVTKKGFGGLLRIKILKKQVFKSSVGGKLWF